MIFDRNAVHADTVEFVRLGDLVCLDFRVGLRNRATFDAVMEVHRGCNNFDPAKVADTIGVIFDDASEIEIGAEGSPVLYVHLPFYTHQRMGAEWQGMGERYTDEQRQAFAHRVIAWARSMDADEISVYQYPPTDSPVWNKPGERPYRVRIWWD